MSTTDLEERAVTRAAQILEEATILSDLVSPGSPLSAEEWKAIGKQAHMLALLCKGQGRLATRIQLAQSDDIIGDRKP